MPKKSFSIYSTVEEVIVKSSDRLIIELGKTHLACLLLKEPQKSIVAFELFDFSENEAEGTEELYNSIAVASKLLGRPCSNTHVYLNHEWCVPVPIYKFNKEIAINYLDVVFGEDPSAKTEFEHLPIDPGIMNVFRLNKEQAAFLKPVSNVNFHHSYSNIIRRHAANAALLPAEFISVQFYHTYLVATIMKEGKLQLIQSFVYENAEDVLYYLLNICDRFQLYINTLTLHISGMIDLEFMLFRELIKYFKQVSVDNVDLPYCFPGSRNTRSIILHPFSTLPYENNIR